uniref:EMILIN-2-like n=1 Tax=Crassostrea virginica TaxID=6565 RepID=A0A8B8BFW9_CRAVI|nr:EMILIN-2-like [Crassostrea virginica]
MDTILTSLKNLVIDNSRTTFTFNSTALKNLIALSNSAKRPETTSIAETKTKLKALQSLVLNNAQTTVKLDSSALKQLLKLISHATIHRRANGIGFSANVKAKALKLGAGQTVIFDEVLTNDGNGYDDRTGVFTCPLAGTYMFVVDSLSTGPTWLHLYLNKTMVATLHVSGYHQKNTYLQMSRTVILKLQRGDHVKVVNFATAPGTVHHQKYSGFSGTLLY